LNEKNDDRRILSVREINEEISAAMERAFPTTVWVRGEVQRLPSDAARRTHLYFELHETGDSGAAEYQIPVALMGWDRQRFGLGKYLDGSDPDVRINNRLEVCLECKVDYYAKFGKLSLKVVGVDRDFALGRLEARRREILEFLMKEGLLEVQKALELPELPLKVGLITSPGSAAECDFMTGLENSPFPFVVHLAGAKMQGEQLLTQVIAALKALPDAGVEVIVLTRGGGSRADLSWFDQQELAVAIAECPLPVLTAIGHEIDTSIADLVAHNSYKTPTAVAESLVDRLDLSADRLDAVRSGIMFEVARILDHARERTDVGSRFVQAVRAATLQSRVKVQGLAGGLLQVTGRRLGTAREDLGAQRVQLKSAALGNVQQAAQRRAALIERLLREAARPVPTARGKLDNLGAQVRLADPARVLTRGYTITQDSRGRTVTRAAALKTGDTITTRFSDGEVGSLVQSSTGVTGSVKKVSAKGKDKRRGKNGDGPEEDSGQQTLFR